MSLLTEQNCRAAPLGGSSQRWTDLDGRPLFLGTDHARIQRHTHTSSVPATGCKHVSLQNHTEWPTRGAFLHTNDDSEELVKGAAPEFLDLGRAPKPAISHFGRPPATGPCALVHQIVVGGSVAFPFFLMISTKPSNINVTAAPSWNLIPLGLRMGRSEQPFCTLCQMKPHPNAVRAAPHTRDFLSFRRLDTRSIKEGGGLLLSFLFFFSQRPDKPLSASSYKLDCDPTWLQMTAWLYAVTPACSSVLNIDTQFIKAHSAWLMQLASWQHDKNCESDYEGHNAAKNH